MIEVMPLIVVATEDVGGTQVVRFRLMSKLGEGQSFYAFHPGTGNSDVALQAGLDLLALALSDILSNAERGD